MILSLFSKSDRKIYEDPLLGDVVLVKSSRARKMSIRVHPVRGIRVSVPTLVPFSAAITFYKSKRQWVIDVVQKQKAQMEQTPRISPEEIEVLRRKAKAELPVRLKEFAQRYGFMYNRVAIKHNLTNWGSCSSKNNINLNLNIMRLPELVGDSILLHELCHLRHRNHGDEFHNLLEKLLRDHVVRRAAEGDRSAIEILKSASKSKSSHPVEYQFRKEIRKYRCV